MMRYERINGTSEVKTIRGEFHFSANNWNDDNLLDEFADLIVSVNSDKLMEYIKDIKVKEGVTARLKY